MNKKYVRSKMAPWGELIVAMRKTGHPFHVIAHEVVKAGGPRCSAAGVMYFVRKWRTAFKISRKTSTATKPQAAPTILDNQKDNQKHKPFIPDLGGSSPATQDERTKLIEAMKADPNVFPEKHLTKVNKKD